MERLGGYESPDARSIRAGSIVIVAEMVMQRPVMPPYAGSSPVNHPTLHLLTGQAAALSRRKCGFESRWSDHAEGIPGSRLYRGRVFSIFFHFLPYSHQKPEERFEILPAESNGRKERAMRTKIGKILTLMLAMIIMASSMTTFAAEATKMVMVRQTAVSGAQQVNGKTVDLGGRENMIYMPVYAPESVSAKASGNRIAISAETTTAADAVQIRYSTDKTFKKSVKTINVANKKHSNSIVVMDIERNLKSNACSVKSATASVVKGKLTIGKETVIKSKLTKSQAISYINASSTIAGMRKKVKTVNSYSIGNVKNPKTFYVQIRSLYKVDGKSYWSNWTTVKVK